MKIDPTTEPSDVANPYAPCKQRDFVAQLLLTVAAANPAVIVLDKFYPVNICSDEETASLAATVSKISSEIPLVLCTLDSAEYDLQGHATAKTPAGKAPTAAERADEERAAKVRIVRNHNATVMFPTVGFGNQVHYGLKALNSDTRKIPLQWPVYRANDFDALTPQNFAPVQPLPMETLASAAVRQYDPTALTQSVIERFNQQRIHPYTSFLTPSQIPTDSAIDLMCDQDDAKKLDWRRLCRTPNLASERLKNLRNRVVVIGQYSDRDVHQTAIGTLFGVVLQANYIESLLDDRYLKPTPLLIQILISVLWVGVIEWIFVRFEANPWRALGYAGSATAFLWFFTYDIAILQLGRYLVLWPPSVLAIISRVATLKLRPETRLKEHEVVHMPRETASP